MINIAATIRWKGYSPTDLSPKSHARIWAVCDVCNTGRWVDKSAYRDRCFRCSHPGRPRKRITKLCKQCGAEIETVPSLADRKQFCSRTCAAKWKSIAMNGSGNHFYGKKHNEASCQKIKDNHADVKGINNPMHGVRLLGENNGNWKGGITSANALFYRSDEYKQWRRTIFIRDRWTCQECGARRTRIHSHHILPYRDWKAPCYSLNVNNGITLCAKCHGNVRYKEYTMFNKYFDIANGITPHRPDISNDTPIHLIEKEETI